MLLSTSATDGEMRAKGKEQQTGSTLAAERLAYKTKDGSLRLESSDGSYKIPLSAFQKLQYCKALQLPRIRTMKLKVSAALLFAASTIVSSIAFAGEDDETWINQCAADNKNANVPAAVVKKYCKCMNEKMSDDEMQSITAWEQSHPKEAKECVDSAISP